MEAGSSSAVSVARDRRPARPDAASPRSGASPAVGAADRLAVTALAAAALALRFLYVFHYRINSDEPQHLHVAWGWTRGWVQYRDVFDNHAPLFHLLFAPIAALVGERADVVVRMRLAVLPLYAVTIAATYGIARAVASRATAVWTALFVALLPAYYLTTVEFRADDLWAAFWLAAVAGLVRGARGRRRAFGVGLALGAATASSLKTGLLLASLGAAFAAARALGSRSSPPAARRDRVGRVIAGIGGFLVLPLALTGFFAAIGALHPLLYGVVSHNLVPNLGVSAIPGRWLRFPPAAALVVWAAWRLGRDANATLAARRRLLVLVAGFYLAALESLWPLVTGQDFLPFFPLAVAAVAPPLLDAASTAVPRALVGGTVAAFEIAALMVVARPWVDHTRPQATLVADVLRLTEPGDPVMDVKGETVFRPRPFFWALESITRERIRAGLIRDDVAERLVATRTYVAVHDRAEFPPAARAFLSANYLPVRRVRVAGRVLDPSASRLETAVPFDVEIPGEYAILDGDRAATGVLDDSPYETKRFLARGRHVFRSPAHSGALFLFWARAVERGYRPFQRAEPAS